MSNTTYVIALTVTCIIAVILHYYGFRSKRKPIRICLGATISPKKSYELHAWCSRSDAQKFIPSRLTKYGYEVFIISPSYTKPGDYTFGVRCSNIKKLLNQLKQDSNFQVVKKVSE